MTENRSDSDLKFRIHLNNCEFTKFPDFASWSKKSQTGEISQNFKVFLSMHATFTDYVGCKKPSDRINQFIVTLNNVTENYFDSLNTNTKVKKIVNLDFEDQKKINMVGNGSL